MPSVSRRSGPEMERTIENETTTLTSRASSAVISEIRSTSHGRPLGTLDLGFDGQPRGASNGLGLLQQVLQDRRLFSQREGAFPRP